MNLNLAEGCGRLGRDQKRFFTTARGSALECAAILDAVETMALLERGEVVRGMQLLVRIVAMLTKMIA
jgi:four helix bundle protein